MSPRAESMSMKPASFFSSSLWKRRFSSNSTSPFLSARTASSAMAPMQSSAKATGLPIALASGSTRGFSDISGTRLPSGWPKWLSTITLAPLSASSLSVGAARSMRMASVTLPSFIGTLRSTRTRTRLPDTERLSMVLKLDVGMARVLAFPDDEYQYLALARGRDQLVAGLLAVGGKIAFRRRIGRAYGEFSADRKLAHLAVGAQHGQRAEQPCRIVFDPVGHSRKPGPPRCFNSSPASLPRAAASLAAPLRSVAITWEPSGFRISPRRCSVPSALNVACPAIGVRHEPSRTASIACSAATHVAVGT